MNAALVESSQPLGLKSKTGYAYGMEIDARICKIPNCNRPRTIRTSAKGNKWHYSWCREHTAENHSRKLLEVSKQKWGESKKDRGYVVVRDETGRAIPRYRLVMEKVLGRKLLPGESVHHKNGIKDDDRPENLELWVGAIRYGQRAVDVECPHCHRKYLEATSGATN